MNDEITPKMSNHLRNRREKKMTSKGKVVRLGQKEYWERKLLQRLSALNEKGIENKEIPKDTAVKMIRAKIRETEGRLQAIGAKDEKAEKMAQRKAQIMAEPKKEKTKKKRETEEAETKSKRQLKKQRKKTEKEKVEGNQQSHP
jgi:hypothetical protein